MRAGTLRRTQAGYVTLTPTSIVSVLVTYQNLISVSVVYNRQLEGEI